jgi:hypothetical protein
MEVAEGNRRTSGRSLEKSISMSKKTREELAKLPFSEKLKILAKLRNRSLAMAGPRRQKAEPKRER